MTKTQSKPALSPEDLLKAAVAGKAETPAAPEVAESGGTGPARSLPAWLPRDARTLGLAGAMLAVGAVIGAGIAALPGTARSSNDAVLALGTTLDAGRIETARLGGEVAQLHQALADLRAASEAARKEAATRSAALGERLGQIDRTLGTRIAGLGDRFDQAEREQTARISNLATVLERRLAPAPVARVEPAQTGSIGEAKAAEVRAPDPKAVEAKAVEKAKPAASERPTVIEGWAVRDVYNGMAVVENRRRRLVEVGLGDTLPGVGRVEGVARHGRDWVVVTRQGIVTPQPW